MEIKNQANQIFVQLNGNNEEKSRLYFITIKQAPIMNYNES